ncbi:MAG: 3-keto-disaccharide hydrolase [Bythopirellula sp.]
MRIWLPSLCPIALVFAALLGGAMSLVEEASAAEKATAAKLETAAPAEGWVSLFNGRDLTGWKVNENSACWKVADGKLIANGERSHLFYVGDVNGGKFKNFEWKCEILTKPNSNSGMYFHTKYQDEGWPSQGYEVQVNNTHHDRRKTGGLYAVADVMDKSPAQDGQWFTQHVIVRDKRIIIKVNGKITADYIEPENPSREESMKDRLLSEGTFALQGHDPGSEVHYRKVMVKSLP